VVARDGGIGGAFAANALGELAQAQGDHELAVRRHAEAGALLGAEYDDPAVVPWRMGQALALIRTGERIEATALAREHTALAEAAGAPYPLAQALRTQAAVDAEADRVTLLRRALTLVAGTGAQRLEAQLSTDLAAMLLLAQGAATGTTSREVVTLLTTAGAWAHKHSIGPLADRARRLLEHAGASAEETWEPVDVLRKLPPTEQYVAQLISGGRSNREVAEHLLTTERGVEARVAQIHRLLGVRAQALLSPATSARKATATRMVQ